MVFDKLWRYGDDELKVGLSEVRQTVWSQRYNKLTTMHCLQWNILYRCPCFIINDPCDHLYKVSHWKQCNMGSGWYLHLFESVRYKGTIFLKYDTINMINNAVFTPHLALASNLTMFLPYVTWSSRINDSWVTGWIWVNMSFMYGCKELAFRNRKLKGQLIQLFLDNGMSRRGRGGSCC